MRTFVGVAAGALAVYFAGHGELLPGTLCMIVAVVAFNTARPTLAEQAEELAELEGRPVTVHKRGRGRYFVKMYGIYHGPYSKRELGAVFERMINKARGFYG